MDDLLIIVPVYVDPKEEVPPDLIERLLILSDLGTLHVVAQGRQIDLIGRHAGTFLQYFEKPIGIWGAVREAWKFYQDRKRLEDIERVVLNLAPLYFDADAVLQVARGLQYGIQHVVGWRDNIAASLSGNPAAGKSRALAECFLTVLASNRVSGIPNRSSDGFTGLQAISIANFLTWRPSWQFQTTWGGALVMQLHSIHYKFSLTDSWLEHRGERTWASSLGDDPMAVVRMLEKALTINIFSNLQQDEVERAIKAVPAVFAMQEWLDKTTAGDEIREIIRFYNSAPDRRFLIPLS
ncbi:MAG: hypothetical protein AAB539_01440 [Patescibacteria group bacterium]